jgi:hypothetical protein
MATMPNRNRKTAGELMAELRGDPAKRAAMERTEAAARERDAALRVAEAASR